MNFLPSFSKGVSTLTDACDKRKALLSENKTLVLTNGCFDLLHAGHVYSLEKASELGDELWVALNSDSSVKSLKGPTRPIYSVMERAYMLCSLKFVSLVFIFEGSNLAKEILQLKPDFYAKSGDYSLNNLNQDEKISLDKVGTEIHFVSLLEGFSTTKIINHIQST
jgi:rfaE bifunctional protein nucleotidyltransferase chain/domain